MVSASSSAATMWSKWSCSVMRSRQRRRLALQCWVAWKEGGGHGVKGGAGLQVLGHSEPRLNSSHTPSVAAPTRAASRPPHPRSPTTPAQRPGCAGSFKSQQLFGKTPCVQPLGPYHLPSPALLLLHSCSQHTCPAR